MLYNLVLNKIAALCKLLYSLTLLIVICILNYSDFAGVISIAYNNFNISDNIPSFPVIYFFRI